MPGSLIDKANQFITSGHPRDLRPLLRICVYERTPEALVAVQKLAGDMYGGITFNLELKTPAAYCLVAWGEQGLRALLENVARIPSSKNHSLAFRILAGLAAGSKARGAEGWVQDGELARLITEAVEDWGEIATAAQVCLNELVMSLAEDDEAALYVATALQGMALLDVGAIKPLFQALSLRWVALGFPQLTQYRDLLARYSNDEPAIHHFLELNPLFLDPLALRVWSKPDLHGKKEPDFIVQRSDNSYLIVEIETPAKPLVTKGNQISSLVTQAVTQVMEYRSFLVERFSDAAATFPNFTMPGALVVIGFEGEMSDSQREVLRRENEHRAHIRILGFDTLADRAEAITRNVIDGNVSVQPGRLK